MAIYQKREKWFIDYYYRGRRVRESLPTRKEAVDALATRKGEILQGRYNWLNEKRSIRFEALKDEYDKYSKANKRSWKRDEELLKNLDQFFHGRVISHITPWLVEKY